MKKKNDGRAPATPAVPDPPVPNRAHTEMKIGNPTPKSTRQNPKPHEERCDRSKQ